MSIIKHSTNSNCWRGCGEKGTLLHCWQECKLVPSLWKTAWRFLKKKKLKIELPYDPSFPLLDIYLETALIQKDTCTPLFTATLFRVAKTWKQPNCPFTKEGVKKIWHPYNEILLSHKKEQNRTKQYHLQQWTWRLAC